MCENVPECLRVFQNVRECSRKFYTMREYSRMFKNPPVPVVLRIFQIDIELSKSFVKMLKNDLEFRSSVGVVGCLRMVLNDPNEFDFDSTSTRLRIRTFSRSCCYDASSWTTPNVLKGQSYKD